MADMDELCSERFEPRRQHARDQVFAWPRPETTMLDTTPLTLYQDVPAGGVSAAE